MDSLQLFNASAQMLHHRISVERVGYRSVHCAERAYHFTRGRDVKDPFELFELRLQSLKEHTTRCLFRLGVFVRDEFEQQPEHFRRIRPIDERHASPSVTLRSGSQIGVVAA
jgi:hypothetical protein